MQPIAQQLAVRRRSGRGQRSVTMAYEEIWKSCTVSFHSSNSVGDVYMISHPELHSSFYMTVRWGDREYADLLLEKYGAPEMRAAVGLARMAHADPTHPLHHVWLAQWQQRAFHASCVRL